MNLHVDHTQRFQLYLIASGNPNVRIPFTVIGSDSGLVSTATSTTDLIIAIAERWDVVIDFAPFIGQNITIMNERDFQTNEDYAETDKVPLDPSVAKSLTRGRSCNSASATRSLRRQTTTFLQRFAPSTSRTRRPRLTTSSRLSVPTVCRQCKCATASLTSSQACG